MKEKLKKQIRIETNNLENSLKPYRAQNPYLSKLEIHVGYQNHAEYIKKMKNYGGKVLFCTGSRAMRKTGFLQKYLNLFKEKGFVVNHYDNISTNPTLNQMLEGIKVAKEFQPDFIFALGGGSVIDTAKAISAGSYGNLWAFVNKEKEIEKTLPIIACATTSGTGSHLTPYAVITNTNTLEKKTLKHPLLCPKISIVDIEILKSIPKNIIAETGFDAICHATEVYTRRDCPDYIKNFCSESMKRIRKHLIGSYEGDSISDKIGMAFADIYTGIALALVGTHVPHAISHPISARFEHISHEKSLVLICAETYEALKQKKDLDFNESLSKISDKLGGGDDLIRTLKNYKKLLRLENGNQRFSQEDRDKIFEDTMGYRKSSLLKSPIPLHEEDIKKIIKNSLKTN